MGHIETAVGMFNAAEVLGEYFLHNDSGTEDEKARRRSTIIPIVVWYIFGIEVGMKALIEKQGKRPGKNHDLKELYDKVSCTIRQKISEKVAATDVNLSSVEDLLTKHRHSFQEWRYTGEFGGILVVAPGALAATLKAIVEVHTEEYGIEMRQTTPDSKGGGIPPSIQDAASEYANEVFQTDVSST